MKTNEKIEFTEDIIETFVSLQRAYNDAGGMLPDLKILASISVLEFLTIIAPNKIRFTIKPFSPDILAAKEY